MINKLIYLASAIENDVAGFDWRKIIEKELKNFYFFNPLKCEKEKTKREVKDSLNYSYQLKKENKLKELKIEMDKIWLADVNINFDNLGGLFNEVYYCNKIKKIFNKFNYKQVKKMGDYEAVISSDLVIAYLEQNVNTVGTIIEIFLASMFNIPVYLIAKYPNMESINSTLIMMVLQSKGKIFSNINDCVNFILKNEK